MNGLNGLKEVAMLVSLYPPEWTGGTEIATKNLVGKLKETFDYNIDVITCRRKGPFKMIRYVFDGIKELRKKKYDIIHCQSIFPALIPFLSKQKYFVYCRGSDVMLAAGWHKWLNKKLLKKATKVISLTKVMQYKILEDYGVTSEIIPNAIDTSAFFSKTKLRKRNQILYIGTLKKVKGVEHLIEALNYVEQDARLVIIGDGPERDNLEDLTDELNLTNKVEFTGMLDSEHMKPYLNESQILVLPSLSEGFSSTLLEAMAAGLPIVATNVGGNPEVIKEGVNGYLVEPKNSEQIADRIDWLLGNKDVWSVINENNLRDVRNYSWKNTIDKLEDIWWSKWD
jgi:glycosyltransferase involved in cell wall biosynthesis